jgi:mRNA interferase RelE/StbE
LAWTVRITQTAERQLERLGRVEAARIRDFLRERLVGDTNPYASAKSLTGEWVGHWRYRVGNYRLICQIRDAELVVMVVKVGHRRDVY